ncbi:tryptophan--tRNA ligase [Bulleidia sp. zg-1006]|uniref:tryptophan--tRNA ligase n=1 Tax=Bulleidia sp. zg-1006 TaxID=2806552 RepID=UPI00193ACD90|nr:tryptophan--tRNA ligase [Bulleidia sp. zg-1006]QRG87341.1 tryptophan--tRNA ligase [Bulleidia sp. zg-1006]
MKKMLSGIKPTGQLHLGNYIGALKNFVQLQDDYEMFVFIANLHCITVPQDPKILKKNLKDCILLYLACGLDPKKSTIFLQTDVPAHAQLGFIMTSNTYLGELNRMTQFKDKQAKGETSLTGGIYTYPSLMAADILLYGADYVPVGEDQKQHVELTRNLAERMNNKYGCDFQIPEPVVPKTGARIMSLQNPKKKMSKSDDSEKGIVYLLDDSKVARKKIMAAVTDMVAKVHYDPENQPGISNLMQIYSALNHNKSMADIEKEFEGKGYSDFKKVVADSVVCELEKIQSNYKRFEAAGHVDEILKEGAERANPIANKTLWKVQKRMGMTIQFKK